MPRPDFALKSLIGQAVCHLQLRSSPLGVHATSESCVVDALCPSLSPPLVPANPTLHLSQESVIRALHYLMTIIIYHYYLEGFEGCRTVLQVSWTIAIPLSICQENGVDYDADEYATSKSRRQVSSYQNLQADSKSSSFHKVGRLAP